MAVALTDAGGEPPPEAVSADAAAAQARAKAAHDELLAYLAAAETEDSEIASALGEKHGVKHGLIADMFNNAREQALKKMRAKSPDASGSAQDI